MRRWTLPMLMALATWAATNPAAAQGLQPQAHCLAQHQGATVPGRLTDRGCTIAWDGAAFVVHDLRRTMVTLANELGMADPHVIEHHPQPHVGLEGL